jgi:hypothetical protein
VNESIYKVKTSLDKEVHEILFTYSSEFRGGLYMQESLLLIVAFLNMPEVVVTGRYVGDQALCSIACRAVS